MSQYVDQRQQQLRDAFAYHQQQIKLATERILQERGADLQRQVEMRELGIADPERDQQLRQEAAEEMARELAQRGVRSGNFSLNDYRDVPDLGINRAEMARNIREEELARQQEAELEAIKQDIDADPGRREARIYADLKLEHADAVSPELGVQPPEPDHELIETVDDLEQESGPVWKYAELERALAEAISSNGAELDAEPERLEFAEDMEYEQQCEQAHADLAQGDGIFAEPVTHEEAPDVEQIAELEGTALALINDPTLQFELDLGEEEQEIAEQLAFFEDLHPNLEHGIEH